MRLTVLVGVLVSVMAIDAQGQTPSPEPAGALSLRDTRLWSGVTLSRQSAPAKPRRVHYCCNLKHALIGAGIGAAIGFGYATMCDAGDCTWTYVKYMGVMGGILGGLGAFVSRQNPALPVTPMPAIRTPAPLQQWQSSDARAGG